MPLAKDLLHPSPEEEKRKHRKKRLVQSPRSYFMDLKCPGCYKITMVFSHAQTVVLCWLLHCPLPAYRRKSKAYRRMFFQEEAALKAL
ncbi:40S ribosomal protein S27 [Saguinus oedipus]|uniref:40S ribosomal protein S27 n=1 Tax=Saguinus oedipus TaxID=9490 RepID=A0ABQ9VW08_SAGOE|nr:40S ribosomal protein S27 [Saguinus oedipus]